jgi:hypothetical protein
MQARKPGNSGAASRENLILMASYTNIIYAKNAIIKIAPWIYFCILMRGLLCR